MSAVSPHGWQTARLRGGDLVFDEESGLDRAIEDGFFYVEQPHDIDLVAGDRFARGFYLPRDPASADPYRGFQRWTSDLLGPRQGYYRRVEDQTEQFFLESAAWELVYPRELIGQAEAMRSFALDILRALLEQLDVPRELWDEATGRALSLRGTYNLTFNHFRPEIARRGLNIHKDSGWVTVLRSTEPGLEVDCDDEWRPIDPVPGLFIVNFGCAMEILTRRTRTPVSAVAHRVVRQPRTVAKPDRFSYALFVDSSLDEEICPGLFGYEPGKGLKLETSFGHFLDNILHNTYQASTTGLY